MSDATIHRAVGGDVTTSIVWNGRVRAARRDGDATLLEAPPQSLPLRLLGESGVGSACGAGTNGGLPTAAAAAVLVSAAAAVGAAVEGSAAAGGGGGGGVAAEVLLPHSHIVGA